jgi:hypothetical protein
MDERTETGWRPHAERIIRVASAGILSGLVAGFVFGGIGGRLAMRLVAVQSDAHLEGLTTDDGAANGEISLGGTLTLVSFVTLVGVVGGLLYLVVRPLLPVIRRAELWGLVTGVIGGSIVVSSDGVDFRVLGSRWVSVAVFVALLGLYGWAVSRLAERWLAPGGLAERSRVGRLGLSFVALLPGFLIVPVVILLAGLTGARTVGATTRLPMRPLVVLGRMVLVAAVVAAAADLFRTVGELA